MCRTFRLIELYICKANNNSFACACTFYFHLKAASSLSHVSSSTPSSTPTDSESHHSGQILHPVAVSESSTQQSLQITDNSVNEEASSDDNAPPPPPISSRPERTKSIVRTPTFYVSF